MERTIGVRVPVPEFVSKPIFIGSSAVERRAVNPRQRRFDSCPVSRRLAGPHAEGSGLQNRRARFDSGASLFDPMALSANGQATDPQSGNGGFNAPGVTLARWDFPEVLGPSSRRGGFDPRPE